MYQLIKVSFVSTRQSNINWDGIEFIKPYSALTAGFIIQILVGGLLAIGNLLPYIASYVAYTNNMSLIHKSNHECTEELQLIYTHYVAQSSWILTASVTGYAICGPIGGRIYILFKNIRWNILIGGVTTYIGILCTFYVLNNMIAIIILFGLIFGLGTGIFWGSSITAAIKWWPDKRGFATGFVIFGMGSGQMVFDLIETMYINPNNIPSSSGCGYMLNPMILQNIPNVFIVLSVISAILTIISIALFFEKTDDDISNNMLQKEELYLAQNVSENIDYSASEAVRTYQFWILFFDCFAMMIVLCFVYGEWKVFAQNYMKINDDAFLLKVGMFSSLLNAIGRIIWGYCFDKTHSYFASMGLASFLSMIFLGTMPLIFYAEEYRKLFVFVWISVLYFCVGAIYAIIPSALSYTFGMKYTAVILGLVTWADIPASIVEGGIVNATQNEWVLLCTIMAILSAFSLVLSFFYPRRHRNVIDYDLNSKMQIEEIVLVNV